MKINEILDKSSVNIKENATAGATAAGAVATSMGAGNGFVNGGPGTIKRIQKTRKKK